MMCLGMNLLQAQTIDRDVFSLLNLDYPGLEKVKAAHETGDDAQAAAELLTYYRQRTDVSTPDLDTARLTLSKREQQWADEALEHTFYVHDGYQPSFNYGKDINWKYWPVEDNELRWQLHARRKICAGMGAAIRRLGEEKPIGADTQATL